MLNGIDGRTGSYLVPPTSMHDAAAGFTSERVLPVPRQVGPRVLNFLPFDVEPSDLRRAGWGLLYAPGTHQSVRDALQPLVELRRAQVDADCFHPSLEYQAGETASNLLERHGVPGGDVDPLRLPYYLLLVGGPEAIPFEIQHSLGLSYAVGRLSFEKASEYEQYARSMVDAETKGPTNHKHVTYWGPAHAGDDATSLSSQHLVRPLHEGRPPREPPVARLLGYESCALSAERATKGALIEELSGKKRRPAVLFTASHGIGFKSGDPDQRERQGALLTADWRGFEAPATASTLAASDVPNDARVGGLVAFVFACFGAGTPERDEFTFVANRVGGQIAPAPFMSALPRRLLSHPNGSALAVIGHVERAWACSIAPGNLAPTVQPFRSALGRIMMGERVGLCLRDFRDRLANASHVLLAHYDGNAPGARFAPVPLLRRWIERNDARNYVVLGDPAARIRPDQLLPAPPP